MSSPSSPAQVMPAPSPNPSALPDLEALAMKAAVLGKQSQSYLVCYVNGKKYQLHAADVQPESTLLSFLRNSCGLTGTKLVCGEGGCGACTVLLSKVDRSTGRVQHLSVNACLFPLGGVDGAHVITVEGIGNPRIGLHPIQLRLAELNGSQCGFCTPGIVMAFYALVRNHPQPTQAQIEHVMDGNLCRCTGYRPILDATKSFAVDRAAPCGMGENCCRNQKKKSIAHEAHCAASQAASKDAHGHTLLQTCSCAKSAALAFVTEPTPLAFREDSALIFPPALLKYHPPRIQLDRPDCVWIKPSDLADLVALKTLYPTAKLVCGNTEAGIDMKFRFDSRPWKTMIYCSDVPELTQVQCSPHGITLGSSVTIAMLQTLLKEQFDSYDAPSRQIATAILSQIHWFAGTQIRNVATMAGNICTASPISDLNPVWQALEGCTMRVAKYGRDEDRVLPGSVFFTGYRQTAMEPAEVLVSVFVPIRTQKQSSVDAVASSPAITRFTHAYKQSRRRADDIAIVTACHQLDVGVVDGQLRFIRASLSYGGMAPATALARKTAAYLEDKDVSLAVVHAAIEVLKQDFPLLDAAVLPGGMAEYRMVLAASFLLKMLYFVWKQIKVEKAGGEAAAALLPEFPADLESATAEYERDVSAGTQTYRVRETNYEPAQTSASAAPAVAPAADSHADTGDRKMVVQRAADRNLVGDPSPTHPAQSGEATRHLSALKQASGEAKYLDDIPLKRDELFVGLVMSTEAHARIVRIDTSALEQHPGYLGFWSAKDIPGSNSIGDIIKDEELYATEFVVCVGTIIGTVVGCTQIEAQQLAKMVNITYERLPAILTIDEAIAAKSFIPPWSDGHTLRHGGDVQAALAAAPHTLSGEARIGGQEHFYLETMQFIVTPGEDDEIRVEGTTQNPNKTQDYVARVLGIGAHKVTCTVRRLGGGFGGKETRCLHLIAAAAIAARKTSRPVRLVLDRDVDMCITGQRHAFLGKYKVGFLPSGKIVAADIDLFANGGCSADLTMPVVDRAIMHVDNAYSYGAVRITGTPCKTNLPSNTAFRGFGGPQGMFVGECIIDAVARYLRMPPEQVRHINLYQQGDLTPFAQPLKEYTVPQQWDHIVQHVDVPAQRAAIAAFNAAHRHRKRGIAIIPTKFGIAFTAKFLNQAGALVLVYADGTVLINCGAVEIGQGIFTKMCQVAAHAFNIPLNKVHISDTSTDKVCNASPTAASASSDLNGAAVLDACNQILARLEPLRVKHPEKTWSELCNMAYFERIGLGATGYYATPGVGYDFVKGEGQPFNYFTTGVACSTVEVDTLTGDHTVLSTHIVMDVGIPINPIIDIGQIEGAFVQGQGLFTTEELVWGDSAHPWVRPGQLLTRGPGQYKLPTANDVPLRMHVELWAGGTNSRAIFSSKGVGEPPLFMAASIFFAIKDALQAQRVQELGADVAHSTPFVLHSPATAERIRMACADPLAKGFMKPGAPADAHVAFQPLGSF
jgi:xanthine dehydrogenase/oxidase